jgi:hypothetical protein
VVDQADEEEEEDDPPTTAAEADERTRLLTDVDREKRDDGSDSGTTSGQRGQGQQQTSAHPNDSIV